MFTKTVDQILSAFTKAVKELEALEAKQLDEVAKNDKAIEKGFEAATRAAAVLNADSQARRIELSKSKAAREKLNAIFN